MLAGGKFFKKKKSNKGKGEDMRTDKRKIICYEKAKATIFHF